MTEIRSVNGDSYSSAVSARGYVALRMSSSRSATARVTLRLGNGIRGWPGVLVARRCCIALMLGRCGAAPYGFVTEGGRFSPPAALRPSTSRSVIGVEQPNED